MSKLLVISVAGLDTRTAQKLSLPGGAGFAPLQPPFPAVTCTSQATFRTASDPAEHGMIANGIFNRSLRKVLFWEQSANLVEGERIWAAYREAGRTVGMLFWQQSLGETVDYVLSPAPIHKHHGGMILDCYSRPRELYARLRAARGEFPLHRYWGPGASARVGDWIAGATADVMGREAPDLLLTYLPSLDYDYQRFGPESRQADRSAKRLAGQLGTLMSACEAHGYDWVVWGDYGIEQVVAGGVQFPNRVLRKAGFLNCREVRGRAYADFHYSRAFAVTDHAVAHVYVFEEGDVADVAQLLGGCRGVERVLTGDQRGDVHLRHGRCGDVVLIAKSGHWFAYPWWDGRRQAPDFAAHVDIHNKPGFDPCELFMQWLPPGVAQNPARVRGTHGRVDVPVVWAASMALDGKPSTLVELADAVRRWLCCEPVAAGQTTGADGIL